MIKFVAKLQQKPSITVNTTINPDIIYSKHNKLINRDLPDQHPMSAISGLETAFEGKQDLISDLSAIRSGAAKGATSLQPNDNISELANNVGYITGITSTDVTTALGYTPYNSSNPNGYTSNVGTVTSVNNTSPDILGNVSISIPTDTSDLTNGAGFITTSALSDYATTSYVDTGLSGKQNTLSQAQMAAVNSGANTTNIGQISTNTADIADIDALIPNQASTLNQLADKDFVNSSIATNTANFIGTFNSVAELEAYSGTLTNNDYAFVATTDSAGNTLYDRYKWNGTEWLFEYELNNSSFTATQWAAINSGATTAVVELAQSALQPNDNISELNNDAGYITGISSSDVTSALGYTPIETIATGSTNGTISVDGTDVSVYGLGSAAYTASTDYATSAQGALAVTAVQPGDLSSYVTKNTAQDITARKTFFGEKAIYFKQNTASDKLGFTLYNNNNNEVAALEFRPNTINGRPIFTLNSQSPIYMTYVGFRYWGGDVNILAPYSISYARKKFFIPVTFTNGTTTVESTSTDGSVDISSLLPTKTSDLTNDNGYITSSSLSGYQTTSNLVTSLSNTSTDTQYPSAKCVYDLVGDVETLINAL